MTLNTMIGWKRILLQCMRILLQINKLLELLITLSDTEKIYHIFIINWKEYELKKSMKVYI